VAKIGQGRPKSRDCGGCLTSAILPNMSILARVIGVQKSRSRRFDLFLWRSRSHIPSTL